MQEFWPRINILKGIFLILRIGLMGASEVFKNQSFKSRIFSTSQKKIYLKLKSWLNLDAIIVFLLMRLKINVNFQKKISIKGL